MSAKNTAKTATRRSFLKNGALLAVPLAAAAAPAAITADDSLKSRLARLEGESAIRNLHHFWLRKFNSGACVSVRSSGHDFSRAVTGAASSGVSTPEAASGEIVRRIAPDQVAAPDVIEIAPGGNSASGRFHCVVEIETPIARDSTLAQMAHAQGAGFLRRSERRLLRVAYAKSSGAWSIASAELVPA